MSRSFAIILREARSKTPDPDHPEKMLTQERLAHLAQVNIGSIRWYEQNKRLPHPLIRKELFRIIPILHELTTTE